MAATSSVSAKPMLNGYTVTTHQDITEQRRSEAKIVHMAMHDALTGLPNRVLFNERLEQALGRVKRGEIAAVHLLDLDHFKNVNDTLGHPAGDKLLKMVTERLQTLVRDADTVARMGGDEFAILQQAISQPADASTLARRVIDAVSLPYEIDDHQVVIGASVGIAVGPSDGTSPDQLYVTRTWRSIVPRAMAGACSVSSRRTWTPRCRSAAPWNTTCARDWLRANSSFSTSRS